MVILVFNCLYSFDLPSSKGIVYKTNMFIPSVKEGFRTGYSTLHAVLNLSLMN